MYCPMPELSEWLIEYYSITFLFYLYDGFISYSTKLLKCIKLQTDMQGHKHRPEFISSTN